MPHNLFLVGHAASVPVVDSLLVRLVELAATYLVHSTLFLLVGWTLVPVLLWCFSKREPDGQECPSIRPALTERVWKLTAVLALATAPLSVLTGWSRPVWEWSLNEQPLRDEVAVVIEPLANPTAVRSESLPGAAPLAEEAAHARPLLESSASLSIEEPAQHEFTSPPAELSFDEPADHSLTERRDDVARLTRNPLDNVAIEPALISSNARPLVTEQSDQLLIADETVDAANQRSNEPRTMSAKLVWLGCVLVVWFVVALGRMLAKGIALQCRLAQYQPATRELSKTLNTLLGRDCSVRLLQARADKTEEPLTLTLSPPRRGARGQEAITEPFACGLFRWTIVLPAGIEQRLSAAEMQALLAHEVAHLVRRDPWWLWLGEVLCTCFAFQPLNFLARRRWQQMSELLCDDWAVERQVSVTSLASCLTKLAEWRLDQRAAVMGLTAVGRAGSLTQRIEWLLRNGRASEPQSPRTRIVATLTTFSLGLLVGLFGPRLTLLAPADAHETQAVSAVEASFGNGNVTTWEDNLAAQLWSDMELDLHHIVSELARLESRLATDPEVASLAQRLRAQAASLQKRVAR